jgi:late competence protein required for DNA uptake (superfamily II DNA/RNA helicase)
MTKLQYNECLLCHSVDAVYACKVCGMLYCNDCTRLVSPDECVHVLYVPPTTDDWKVGK